MEHSIHIIYHDETESGDKAVLNVYELVEGGGIKIVNLFVGKTAKDLYSALVGPGRK